MPSVTKTGKTATISFTSRTATISFTEPTATLIIDETAAIWYALQDSSGATMLDSEDATLGVDG